MEVSKFKIFACVGLSTFALIVTGRVATINRSKNVKGNLKMEVDRESGSPVVSEVGSNDFNYPKIDQQHPETGTDLAVINETSTDMSVVSSEVNLEEFGADRCLITKAD